MAEGVSRAKRLEDLSEEQRRAALARRNVVVAAGAGSGKTTVLAARYVDLVENGRMADGSRTQVRNILALTFTNKARAEMYERILGALDFAARKALAEGRSELAAHLSASVEGFSQARIVTFDAFALGIARAGSARWGLSPDFRLDDEEVRTLCEREALAFVLERRDEEAMRALVAANGFVGAVEDLLAGMAASRLVLAEPPDFEAMRLAQAVALAAELKAVAESLADDADAAAALASASDASTVAEALNALRDLAEPPESSEAPSPDYVAALDRCASVRKPSSAAKGELGAYFKERWDEIRAASQRAAMVARALLSQDARKAMYALLQDFSARVLDARRAAGLVGFRDVAVMARRLLSEDPGLRAMHKARWRYLMVDEFQDDDELQKDILFLLAERMERMERGIPGPADLEPDKLFFVGDDKQSVYLFRGADVSVFNRLGRELEASPPCAHDSGPRRLPLNANFRSEPALVDFFNAIFGALMADAASDHEARFSPLGKRAAIAGASAGIEWHELARNQEIEGQRPRHEVEAWAMAEWIRRAVEDPGFLVADRASGQSRRARWEDFAILQRSTGRQVHLEKYLRLLGIPYAAESACGLFAEAVASDLLLALTLLARPSDRLAYAAVLRSPLARLSDDALVSLLSSGGEAFEPEAESLADPGDAERYALIRGFFARARALVDLEPISRLLSYFWFEGGYRAALLASPSASAFEEHFEALHGLAAKADARGQNLAAFVAEWEGYLGRAEKLEEADFARESARGVRLMTIHKSKGLEFPVVLIGGAENAGRNESAGAWNWDEGLGVSLRLAPEGADPKRRSDALFERGKEERAERRAAEDKRLLYVACTRAETRLAFFSVAPSRADNAGRSFRAMLAGALARLEGAPSFPVGNDATRLACGLELRAIRDRSDAEYLRLLRGSAAGSGARALPSAAELLALGSGAPSIGRSLRPAALAITELARAAAAEPDAEALEWLDVPPGLDAPAGLSSEAWGSLVHACLELALSRRAGEREGRVIDTGLLSPLPKEGREAALDAAKDLAAVFLESPLGARALAARERDCELSLLIRLDSGRLARGIADLVFVEGEGGSRRVILVDYKTDRRLDPGLHQAQVAAYREACASVYGAPCEAWIFYLYGGGVAIPVSEEARLLASADPAPEPRAFGFGPRAPEGANPDEDRSPAPRHDT